jgi:hypothetical protein
MFYLVLRCIVRPSLAFAWGALLALDPTLSAYGNKVLSDIPFLFLLTTALAVLFAALRAGRWAPGLVVGGLLLGAATLVRPILLFLPALLAIGLAFGAARTPGPRILRLLGVGLMLVLAYAGPYAWIRHIEAEFGYGGISWIGPVNLLDYKAANVVKRARGGGGEREEIARELSDEADRRAGEGAGLDARASARRTLFLEVLREHPGPAVIAALDSLRKTLTGDAVAEFAPRGSPGRAVYNILKHAHVVGCVILMLLAFRGVFRGLGRAAKGAPRSTVAVAILVVVVLVGLALFYGAARFRVPVLPELHLLAAVGWGGTLVSRSGRD